MSGAPSGAEAECGAGRLAVALGRVWTQLSEDVGPRATGGSRRGSPRGAGIASLPWNQALVTGTHTPGKAQKGELEGRRHIYHHVTAPHNTCAHVREVYLPRARCGRPGTRAAGEKRGRQGRASTASGPSAGPCPGELAVGAPRRKAQGRHAPLRWHYFHIEIGVKGHFRAVIQALRTWGRTEPGLGSSRWFGWAAGLRRGSGDRLSRAAGDTGPVTPLPSEGLQAGGRAESHVQGWFRNAGWFPEAGQRHRHLSPPGRQGQRPVGCSGAGSETPKASRVLGCRLRNTSRGTMGHSLRLRHELHLGEPVSSAFLSTCLTTPLPTYLLVLY